MQINGEGAGPELNAPPWDKTQGDGMENPRPYLTTDALGPSYTERMRIAAEHAGSAVLGGTLDVLREKTKNLKHRLLTYKTITRSAGIAAVDTSRTIAGSMSRYRKSIRTIDQSTHMSIGLPAANDVNIRGEIQELALQYNQTGLDSEDKERVLELVRSRKAELGQHSTERYEFLQWVRRLFGIQFEPQRHNPSPEIPVHVSSVGSEQHAPHVEEGSEDDTDDQDTDTTPPPPPPADLRYSRLYPEDTSNLFDRAPPWVVVGGSALLVAGGLLLTARACSPESVPVDSTTTTERAQTTTTFATTTTTRPTTTASTLPTTTTPATTTTTVEPESNGAENGSAGSSSKPPSEVAQVRQQIDSTLSSAPQGYWPWDVARVVSEQQGLPVAAVTPILNDAVFRYNQNLAPGEDMIMYHQLPDGHFWLSVGSKSDTTTVVHALAPFIAQAIADR